ncbi:hypothetical protein [Dietzia sp. B32]|uniref:hypothetical protein n=1 Tax=Dietzia sp. B32 TaxID=2915130 RepID=UPI0021AD916A|nr:hypothetical protein [Dietzia sp. B32]UVE94178.1 hypothetical protein L8M95_11520 [Dietzia sp. B32]
MTGTLTTSPAATVIEVTADAVTVEVDDDAAAEALLRSSARKIRTPYVLDPELCLYTPQANVASLANPRLVEWHAAIRDEWTPTPVEGARRRLGLLLPCTKYKPYFTSREHRGINSALLTSGWKPLRPFDGPAELLDLLEPDESPDLFANSPLVRDGVVLDRFVLSEPMAVVPYELTMEFRGSQSPATSYDDPGLFERRAKEPWGPAEREAYVEMHNAMADAIAAVLGRIGRYYDVIGSWTSPGLTHRSFLADAAFRDADGLPHSRAGVSGDLPLRGALDTLGPDAVRMLPLREDIDASRAELADRLAAEGRSSAPASVRAVFARGDGHDTPLGLPELTARLAAAIDEWAEG